jgi:hypothetical protein
VFLTTIALLILDTHYGSNVILAILFATGFIVDASLRIAATIMVRYAGWRLAIAAGALELLIAVFFSNPGRIGISAPLLTASALA